ncbi:hypothetical protein ACPPVU_01300 [Mucilaginibacter sp. McL0603]|uniref:hypothetical protein n=1 Tax=Mucilaginibacter sp. McL0603 TaxID=3415670 RepID=UPI003CFAC3CE
MKTLSYFLMVATFASVTFSSCKKDSTPAPTPTPAEVATSMKLTSNGTALSFNQCQQFTVSANGLVQTEFIAKNFTNGKLSDDEFEVDIIHDPATLKAGQTYPAASSYAQKETADITYYPNDTDIFTTQIGNPQATVTITEVTATTISGTFSGKLFAWDDTAGNTVVYTITNGSFTAKIDK